MRRIIAFAPIALLFASPDARPENATLRAEALYTGKDLYDLCATPNGDIREGLCRGYVAGIYDGSSLLKTPLVHAYLGRRWCMPKSQADLSQLVAIIQKWLETHPEQWHQGAASIIATALLQAFPCK